MRRYAAAVATATDPLRGPELAPAPTAPARSARIDGLRALAATLVLTFHAWWNLRPEGIAATLVDGGDPARLLNSAVMRFGTVGVALFYVISGYLLYRPFLAARSDGSRPDTLAYAIRRAARIIPAYWVSLVIIGLLVPATDVFSLRGLKAYFLFGQVYSFADLRAGFPLPPMWTICVEVSFYVFLPFWAWFAARACKASRRPVRTEFLLLGGLAAAAIAWRAFAIATSGVESGFQPKLVALPASLDLFAAGMALAAISVFANDHRRRLAERIAHPTWAWWLLALALLAAIAATARPDALLPMGWEQSTFAGSMLKLPMAAAIAIPIVLAGSSGGAIRRLLGSRPVAWVGLVSYGLYLWHSWVISELAKREPFASPSLSFWPVDWILAFVLSLACAAASWYLVERWTLTRAHRASARIERRRQAGS